ncbi:MAG: cupredoxin domain-containing protein [Planctomycetota bacterium]|jgi:heme/copper-type cytochrome/quinol oxidase subunit 2
MKGSKIFISAVLLLLCTVAPIVAVLVYEKYRTSDLTAEIIARAPEKGNFSPQHLVIPVGEKVKLRVRNVDTVMHGFAIPAMRIDLGELKAGHSEIVEFTPEETGKYDFYCTVWCSEHHMQMRGIIEVVAK